MIVHKTHAAWEGAKTEQKQFVWGREIQWLGILRDSLINLSCATVACFPLSLSLSYSLSDEEILLTRVVPLFCSQEGSIACLWCAPTVLLPSWDLARVRSDLQSKCFLALGPRQLLQRQGRDAVREGRAFQGNGILHVQYGLEKQEGKRSWWLPGFHGRRIEGVSDAPCSWHELAQLRCNGTSLLWQPLCIANCSVSADLPSPLAEAAHLIKEWELALGETRIYFFPSHCVCFLSHYWVSRGFISNWFRKNSGVADQTSTELKYYI